MKKTVYPLFILMLLIPCIKAASMNNDDRIQPWKENPRYWQYKGKPVLLLGGTVDDNLFQIPGLKSHLDLLASVGGNYIRNTMSARDEGNVQPFGMRGDKYDLSTWNPEYWTRFENLLKWTKERDIIVQVELWAIWDMFYERWEQHPWNPAMNVNYTNENTNLKPSYGNPAVRPYLDSTMHDFYFTVPALANDKILLKHQQAFVDKILSYSLNYGNVLYCVTNEIFIQFSPEWGWYWADYVRKAAEKESILVNVAEMYQYPVLRHPQHKASLDHPEIFDFEDISQNAGRYGVDENHWDNFRYIYDYIEDDPRPINHVKTYGGERNGQTGIHDAREKFLRSIVGGAASMRFHRPPSGIGLNEAAQATIAMVRRLEILVKFWEMDVRQDLLSDRESDEAYLRADPGNAYLLYFTDGGSVKLDLSEAPKNLKIYWIRVGRTDWDHALPWEGGGVSKISAPGRGGWIAVLIAEN